MTEDACGDQKKASDPLELTFQTAVIQQTQALGTELKSSTRVVNTLNHLSRPSF